jgi:aminopeptidase YwaD
MIRSRSGGPRHVLAILAALALALAACSGDESGASNVATEPTTIAPTGFATATIARPEPSSFAATDGERAFEDLRVLVEEIGSRTSTSDEERSAADYIATQLEIAGYEVTIETFDAPFAEDQSSLALDDGTLLESARGLRWSPNASASGPLIRAGLGGVTDLNELDVTGAIAVVDRGILRFDTKAFNTQQAGAVALIVINNVPGPLAGALSPTTEVTIPVVGIDQADGAALDLLVDDGGVVTVTSQQETGERPSQNVVARPSQDCSAYVGAHYDSVAEGPGANDNASGTVAMIEIARTHHADGLCYIAFGSEEIGLVGSQAFVEQHDVGDARFMLNLDMVGKMTGAQFIADRDAAGRALASRASAVALTLGHVVSPGSFPATASSDHAVFAAAGVPAITVHSGDDPLVHQAADDIDNVSAADLATMLEITAAVLEDLLLD